MENEKWKGRDSGKMIKPTLLSIKQRTQTGINTEQIAHAAGVSLGDAYIVEIGGFVNPEIAHKVVSAFSLLSGQQLTVDDIRLQNISASPIASSGRWLV